MCSIDTVKELISITNVHNLEEIEIHHEMTRIRIKKNGLAPEGNRSFEFEVGGGNQVRGTFFPPYNDQGSMPDGAIQSGLLQEPFPPLEEKFLLEQKEITSPMVGTFYRTLEPGSEPKIDVGDEVDAETMVGVIETMKIKNDIKAGVAGKVVEVLVEDGAAVEYGQPLFLVQM